MARNRKFNALTPPFDYTGQILYDAIVAPSDGDFTDVQAAIDAGHKRIFIRAGTYTLAADITIASADTWLVAESVSSIIDGGSSFGINLNGQVDCRIIDLAVTSTLSSGAIRGSAAHRTIIDGTKVTGSIQLTTAPEAIKIIKNRVTNPTGIYGIRVTGAPNTGGVISGNTVEDVASTSGANAYGIYADWEHTVSDNSIRNIGSSVATEAAGIYCDGGHVTFTGNRVQKVIAKATSGGEVYGIRMTSECVATGNSFGQLGDTDSHTVYVVRGGNESTITGNRVSTAGNTTSTVEMRGFFAGTRSTVGDNVILSGNAKAAGGSLYVARIYGIGNSVTGNVLTNISAATVYGVYMESDCEGSEIIGNNFYHPREAGILTAVAFHATGNLSNTVLHNGGAQLIEEVKFVYAKNTSGGSLAAGDVVVIKSVAAGNEITTTTTGGDDKAFGMVTGAISNNAFGFVQTLGKTTLLKVNGVTDVAVGDHLSTFTTAGISKKATAGDKAFAIALEAYSTDDSSGIIDALLVPPTSFSASTIDHGGLTGLADDDHTQYVLRSILTTNGDTFTRSGGVISRLAIGTTNQLLGVTGGLPAWQTGILDASGNQRYHLRDGTTTTTANWTMGTVLYGMGATALSGVRLAVGNNGVTGFHHYVGSTATEVLWSSSGDSPSGGWYGHRLIQDESITGDLFQQGVNNGVATTLLIYHRNGGVTAGTASTSIVLGGQTLGVKGLLHVASGATFNDEGGNTDPNHYFKIFGESGSAGVAHFYLNPLNATGGIGIRTTLTSGILSYAAGATVLDKSGAAGAGYPGTFIDGSSGRVQVIEFIGQSGDYSSSAANVYGWGWQNDNLTTGDILYFRKNAEVGTGLPWMTITRAAGLIGIGLDFSFTGTRPTALMHLSAGTTATAPFKLTSGTSTTTALAGAIEMTTDNLFFVITTGTARKRIAMADAVGGLTAGRMVVATTNGRLADATLSSVYTPTNVTTDRSFDADATTLDEIADVLGTLIADHQAVRQIA